MKHLIIILSLLLLSSPVIGQETGVLYQYESFSGIQWKTFGNEKLQPKYEGQITFGELNGQGTYTWSDGRKYVGDTRMGNKMVKGHTFTMMEGSMKGNGRLGENGTEQDITKMGKSL